MHLIFSRDDLYPGVGSRPDEDVTIGDLRGPSEMVQRADMILFVGGSPHLESPTANRKVYVLKNRRGNVDKGLRLFEVGEYVGHDMEALEHEQASARAKRAARYEEVSHFTHTDGMVFVPNDAWQKYRDQYETAGASKIGTFSQVTLGGILGYKTWPGSNVPQARALLLSVLKTGIADAQLFPASPGEPKTVSLQSAFADEVRQMRRTKTAYEQFTGALNRLHIKGFLKSVDYNHGDFSGVRIEYSDGQQVYLYADFVSFDEILAAINVRVDAKMYQVLENELTKLKGGGAIADFERRDGLVVVYPRGTSSDIPVPESDLRSK